MKEAEDLSGKSVVYFLKQQDQIVYVGKSNNVSFRIAQHRKSKSFDSVEYLHVHPDDLAKDLENAFIKIYHPILNITKPSLPFSNSDADLLSKYGVKTSSRWRYPGKMKHGINRLYTYNELKNLWGISYTKVHLLRLEKQGKFPKRVYLSPHRIAWSDSEIRAWVAEKMIRGSHHDKESAGRQKDIKRLED